MAISSSLINAIGLLLECAGLAITAATFWRINTLRKMQVEERELMRQLYGTDTLADRLRSAATFLKVGADVDARALAEELVRLVGQIEGITRVLETLQSSHKRGSGSFIVSNENYFTLESIRKDFRSARSNVDILIYRNMFISSPGILDSMEGAAIRGVRIRILCISSAAEEEVLKQTLNILPRPVPDTAEEFRRQLLEAEQRIARVVSRDWSANARQRLDYRGYTIAPVWHLVRVDNVLKLGFVGTSNAAQPSRYEDRPYVMIPVGSPPGEILVRHLETIWQQSSEHSLDFARQAAGE